MAILEGGAAPLVRISGFGLGSAGACAAIDHVEVTAPTGVLASFDLPGAPLGELGRSGRLEGPATALASAFCAGDADRFDAATQSALSPIDQSELPDDTERAALVEAFKYASHPVNATFGVAKTQGDETVRAARTAMRILGSTNRVNELMADLLDFSTTHLGAGIPIKTGSYNLGPQCTLVVDEIRSFHPDRKVVLELTGELEVEWDRARINQALSNLIGNAIEHGAPGEPVWVSASGDGDWATS